MNIRRGLWRLWLVLAIVWIGFALWTTPEFPSCLFRVGAGPWCDYWTAVHYIAAVETIFGIPLALLIIGWVGFWIAAGFKRRNS
jgi:hypothetical protein